jgi:choline transport protein
MAASLAEIFAVFPSPNGQVDWAYLLAPNRFSKALCYFTGWNACAAWIAFASAAGSLTASLYVHLADIKTLNLSAPKCYGYDRHVAPGVSQSFLAILPGLSSVTFFAIALDRSKKHRDRIQLACFVLNAFAVRILPYIDRGALFWALGGFVLCAIVCLATASPNYQRPSFVFGAFINETGWPNGVTFILGLLQSTFSLTAFDGAAHLCEEMRVFTYSFAQTDVRKTAPSRSRTSPRSWSWPL